MARRADNCTSRQGAGSEWVLAWRSSRTRGSPPGQQHKSALATEEPVLPADPGVLRSLCGHVFVRGDLRDWHHWQPCGDVHRVSQLLHAEHLQLSLGQPGLLGLSHHLLLPSARHLSWADQEVAAGGLLLQDRALYRGMPSRGLKLLALFLSGIYSIKTAAPGTYLPAEPLHFFSEPLPYFSCQSFIHILAFISWAQGWTQAVWPLTFKLTYSWIVK